MNISKDLTNELKGKTVEIIVAFGAGMVGGGSAPHAIKGKVSHKAFNGSDFFVVFEDGTMINTRYIQTIKIVK